MKIVETERGTKEKASRVIVIRHDEFDVLVVVRIPDGSDGESVFKQWATATGVTDTFDDGDLAEAYWEELSVIEL